MNDALTAIALLGGLTLAFGVVLSFAHRRLRVEVDPRLLAIEPLLGGSNCGACGRPGCAAFAAALLSGECSPSQCSVAPASTHEQIAALLGVDAGSSARRVARLRCAGGRSKVPQLASYQGSRSCAAAYRAQRGGRACAYGCLGHGDCAHVCRFEAIQMSDDALPIVDPARCTACGDCVTACPAQLFTLEPSESPLILRCNSPLVGEAARASCRVACDGCGRCAADAEAGAICMEQGLPRILDRERAGARCTQRCPSGAIVWVGSGASEPLVPARALWRNHG
jgi:Na+-translocating ferredoxin:NAD+ oxidoreductase RNF subunit RnfB